MNDRLLYRSWRRGIPDLKRFIHRLAAFFSQSSHSPLSISRKHIVRPGRDFCFPTEIFLWEEVGINLAITGSLVMHGHNPSTEAGRDLSIAQGALGWLSTHVPVSSRIVFHQQPVSRNSVPSSRSSNPGVKLFLEGEKPGKLESSDPHITSPTYGSIPSCAGIY